jgi:Fibronectin type III domain
MNIKRGRGSHRGICLCAVAALGITLSGCGGDSGGSAAATTAVQSSPSVQQPIPPQGSTGTVSPASTQSAPPAGSASPPAAAGTGSSDASLPTPGIGSITLHWLPPTENVDGTPLANLAGFDIHYGTASGNYTHTISVANPGIATYVVDDLTPGTYYFSVAAVNDQGTESPLSPEVRATVN